MKFTLKEMQGLLNGKCLPSDLIVGETLAEYLVRKFDELEQKLAESQREFRAADATIENLQMQVEKLAAENAGLKKANEIALKILNDEETLVTSLWASSVQEVEVKTPATDAFLAEVRAQGVEMMAAEADQLMDEFGDDSYKVMVTADLQRFANAFAAQLRQESAQ
ncbi:TPA: hypothetical protein N5O09_000421 [Enterobacter roggenkampii]|nr:hypothetical protein [Enterobacter roggenkampii]